MLKEMPFNLEYLTSLRREIETLRALNADAPSRQKRSSLDRSAIEARASRLLEIKQELGRLLTKPTANVWW